MSSEKTPPPLPPLTCLLLAPRENGFGHELRRNIDRIPGVTWITFTSEVQYGGFASEIATQIPRTIESADAVIADLTNADPNVMYELGFAHALKKPVLPIVQRSSSPIPSDLQGYLFYAYDDPFQLAITVERWLYRTFGDRFK
jgi:hypothetical protein